MSVKSDNDPQNLVLLMSGIGGSCTSKGKKAKRYTVKPVLTDTSI